jgi:hypothetical protein
MKDSPIPIERIINSFRAILIEVFDLQGRKDNSNYIKKFFKPGHEKGLNERVNAYFDQEIEKTPYDAKDLNVMRDGVLYLLERIKCAPHEVKVLLYVSLFHEDEIFTEVEIQNLMENFDFFN